MRQKPTGSKGQFVSNLVSGNCGEADDDEDDNAVASLHLHSLLSKSKVSSIDS